MTQDVGRTLGRAGLRLLRESAIPAGRSRLEVEGLLERSVERGFGDALLGLVESRAGRTASMFEASRVVLQLSRSALEQELANAPFVEQHLRAWCTDAAGWNTMLRDFGLAAGDAGTPTALTEALREALEHERVTRSTSSDPDQAAPDLAFFDRDEERPRGHAGALLVDQAETQKSALAARALRDLECPRTDWSLMLHRER